jgi:hypothetical protein
MFHATDETRIQTATSLQNWTNGKFFESWNFLLRFPKNKIVKTKSDKTTDDEQVDDANSK